MHKVYSFSVSPFSMNRKKEPCLDRATREVRANNRMEAILLRGKLQQLNKQSKQIEKELLQIRETKLSLADGLVEQKRAKNQEDRWRKEVGRDTANSVKRNIELSAEKLPMNGTSMCFINGSQDLTKSRLPSLNKMAVYTSNGGPGAFDDKIINNAEGKEETQISDKYLPLPELPNKLNINVAPFEGAVTKLQPPRKLNAEVNNARFLRRHSDASILRHVPITCLPNIVSRRSSSPDVLTSGASLKSREVSCDPTPRLGIEPRNISKASVFVAQEKAISPSAELSTQKTNQDLVQEACLKSKFRQIGHVAIGAAILNRRRRYSVANQPMSVLGQRTDDKQQEMGFDNEEGNEEPSQVERQLKLRQDEITEATRIAWVLKSRGLTRGKRRHSEPCVLRKR